ncbi:MAG: hypothetical protein RIG84_16500 [Roseovarius sp.]
MNDRERFSVDTQEACGTIFTWLYGQFRGGLGRIESERKQVFTGGEAADLEGFPGLHPLPAGGEECLVEGRIEPGLRRGLQESRERAGWGAVARLGRQHGVAGAVEHRGTSGSLCGIWNGM